MERFWSKAETGDSDACWPWTASKNLDGYGWFRLGPRPHLAHRIAWSLTHAGEVPNIVDHECHNLAVAQGECAGGVTCPHRACVNPSHLRNGTRAENGAASPLVLTTINAAKTECVNGHPFSGDNLAVRDGGKRRRCLACARKAKNECMARKRARALLT